MEWKTSIAKSEEGETLVRGYELEDMIKNLGFTEAIYLVLKGELPSEAHKKVMDAIFVACVDHGINPPSVLAARAVASGGNSFNASVAAGVSALGDYHGGAIENCAQLLLDTKDAKKTVKEALESKKRLAGFGHRMYTVDPRTKELFEVAKEVGVYGKYCDMALGIEKELETQKGKKLCLNVDGAIAALTLEMGFPPTLGKAFFIIPRTVGLCAHVHEELTEERPVLRSNLSPYYFCSLQRLV